MYGEACGGQGATRNAGVGEEGGTQRSAADGAGHVPRPGQVPRRENAVGEDDRLAIRDQQHFAYPGRVPGRQADHVALIGERTFAGFGKHPDREGGAAGNDACRQRLRIAQPAMQRGRRAGQAGTGLPAKILAGHRC